MSSTPNRKTLTIKFTATPTVLVDRYGISGTVANQLIATARRRYNRGMMYQELKDAEGTAFLTWDSRNNEAVLEIWN